MLIIPDFVPIVITAYWTQLLQWFSDQVYAELIERDPDHLLVRPHARLDFSHIEEACAGYHHISGAGAKPTHLVASLVGALLVGYLFNWSLRQLEWHIRYNVVVK